MLRLAISMTALLLPAIPAVPQDPPLRTGARFRAQLQEPLVARWENVRLRDILERLREDGDVAILLDRRIDPSQTPLIEFTNVSLKDGLSQAASEFQAGISLPENVIYLGPPDACRKLRTLIALRTAELSGAESRIPKDRQQSWLRPRTVRWDDLDSPRDILARLETDLSFQMSNPHEIEHDLWAGATLPDVSGIAALSLALIQFDLTFAWREAGDIVELTAIPDTVVIERPHAVRGRPVDQTLAEWQAAWPDLEFRKSGGAILAVATIEEHEALGSGSMNGTKPFAKSPPKPLSQRRFDGQIKDISARHLMAELEKSGIVFDYDAQALAAAGVDLDRLVQINARKLPAKEFFHAVFDPLGIACTIDGVTVMLRPK